MSTLTSSQSLVEIAGILYRFLPGKPHPFADQRISFEGVSRDLGLIRFWNGGSKRPALSMLLDSTYTHSPRDFSPLIVEISKRGIIYLKNKNEPITREEIGELNRLLLQLGLKIPELLDRQFLNNLEEKGKTLLQVSKNELAATRDQLVQLSKLRPQARGFAFEKFLQRFFELYGLAPHASFKLVGEQIDGSIQLEHETYLLEAKWQNEQIGVGDLLIFHSKVEAKSAWSRGVFISYSGFTRDGLVAYRQGRSSNIVCVTGEDIAVILEGKISLTMAIRAKVRAVAERGDVLTPVRELVR